MFNVDHKLRVFISSSMQSTKYLYARHELKYLLTSTGLFEVFVYEEEGASAEGAIDFYVKELPHCDVAIFLIDNEDGVSEAVEREIQGAFENELRKIFIFCDENSKKRTDIQEKLKADGDGPKYVTVHDFKDAASKAYISLIQDLLRIYRPGINNYRGVDPNLMFRVDNHDNLQTLNSLDRLENDICPNTVTQQALMPLDVKNIVQNEGKVTAKTTEYSIDKKNIHAENAIVEYLIDLVDIIKPIRYRNKTNIPLVSSDCYDTDNDSDMKNATCKDNLSGSNDENIVSLTVAFLASVMGKKEFDSIAFEKLTTIIISKQPAYLSVFLKNRFLAIKHLLLEDVKGSLDFLKKSLEEGISNPLIPEWLILDVAIDLKNIVYQRAGNTFSKQIQLMSNEEYILGQNAIEKSNERITYPVVDRLQYELSQEIVSNYEKQQLCSPYVIPLTNDSYKVFDKVADIYWLALLHGSYSHIFITRDRMISILTMFINLYSNRAPVIERIRLHYVIGEDGKKLEEILRTYHSEADVFTPEESCEVIRCIKMIKPKEQALIGLFGFVGRFGYYLDDNTFESEYEKLYENALKWIEEEIKEYEYQPYIFEFLAGTKDREYKGVSCLHNMIDFIIILIEKTQNKWLNDICDMLLGIDYSNLDPELVRKLIVKLTEKIDDNCINYVRSLENVLFQIIICRHDYSEFIRNIIKLKAPKWSKNTFELQDLLFDDNNNLNEECSAAIFERVVGFINEIKAENELARKGTIALKSSNTIRLRNLINAIDMVFSKEQLSIILKICIDSLAIERLPVNQKIYVCEILISLCRSRNKDNDQIFKDVLKKFKDCQEIYVRTGSEGYGFDKDIPFQLELVYELVLVAYGNVQRYEVLSEMLVSIPHRRSYVLIKVLNYLFSFLAIDRNNKLTSGVLDIIMNFVLSISDTIERDVKIWAIKTLVQLCSYQRTRARALRRLSVYMGEPNSDARLAVISRIQEIIEHDPFKDKSRSEIKKISVAYINQIISNARIDRNYLIRKYAEKCNK